MTNREYYEKVSGMGLEDIFFKYNNINIDKEYKDKE